MTTATNKKKTPKKTSIKNPTTNGDPMTKQAATQSPAPTPTPTEETKTTAAKHGSGHGPGAGPGFCSSVFILSAILPQQTVRARIASMFGMLGLDPTTTTADHPQVAQIAEIFRVTVREVCRIVGVKSPKIAPVYGAALSNTPEPATPFEARLKEAGKHTTLDETVASVAALSQLHDEARRTGDVQASYAVTLRAVTLAYRSRFNGKTEVNRLFRELAGRLLTCDLGDIGGSDL